MTALPLVITRAGLARFTAAQLADDIDLTIATVGLTAQGFAPAPTLTALPGEHRRVDTVSGVVVGDETVHLTIRDEPGPAYTVRGIGLFLSDGTLLAVYGQADPIMEKSAQTALLLAIDVAFPVSGVDRLVFGDTDFLLPPASTDAKGLVELATRQEALAGKDTFRVPPVAQAQAMMEARLPAGVILLWAGAAETVPAGWAICNGQAVDLAGGGRVITPDLRGRVAVGVSPTREVGTRFGLTEAQSSEAGAHDHSASAAVAAAPSGLILNTTTRNVDAGGSANGVINSATLTDPGHAHTATVGIDQAGAHRHTVDVTQPSIALHYIMRL